MQSVDTQMSDASSYRDDTVERCSLGVAGDGAALHHSTEDHAYPRAGRVARRHRTLRTLLVIQSSEQRLQAESALKRAGLRSVSASDGLTARRWLERDPDIGVVALETNAAGCADGELMSAIQKSRAAELYVTILMVPPQRLMDVREIARFGGIDVLGFPPMDEELVSAARQALRRCNDRRRDSDLRLASLRLLNVVREQADELLERMDGAALIESPSHDSPHANSAPVEEVGEPSTSGELVESPSGLPGAAPVEPRIIKALLRMHTVQQSVLGQGLIDDAAWLMLLDLLLSHLNGKQLGVTALCVGVGAPQTTALRRLNDLIAGGLAEKTADPYDRRRIFVSITPNGVDKISTYIQRMREELRAAEQPDVLIA